MTLDLVADTNIIFSALITRGKIRKLILLQGNIRLHAPIELREELHKHAAKLQEYIDATVEEIRKIIDTFLEETTVLHPKEEYKHLLEEAEELAKETDPSDAPFIALSIHLGAPLWTGDKELIKLAVKTGFREFTALDTHAVEMLLEGKSWEEIQGYLREKYQGNQ